MKSPNGENMIMLNSSVAVDEVPAGEQWAKMFVL